MIQFTIFLICLPTLIFAWPIEQKPLPVEVWRNEAVVPWYLPNEVAGIQVQLRSLDGPGAGVNILRQLAEPDMGNWLGLGSGGNSGDSPWRRRFSEDDGAKRRGGLDSLGRGNILKRSTRQ